MPFSIAGPASAALPSMDLLNRAAFQINAALQPGVESDAAESAISGRLDSVVGESTINIRNAISQVSALQKADQTLGQMSDILSRAEPAEIDADKMAADTAGGQTVPSESQDLVGLAADTLDAATYNGQRLFGASLDMENLKVRLDSLRAPSPLNPEDISDLQDSIASARAEISGALSAASEYINQTPALAFEQSQTGGGLPVTDLASALTNLFQAQTQFEAEVKVFSQQKLGEQTVINLLSQ